MIKTITETKLKEKLKKHEMWLKGEEGGEKADLSNTDLENFDLRGADLREADLHGANLCYNALKGTNFAGANLKDANLDFADFTEADFTGADLRGATYDKSLLDEIIAVADKRKETNNVEEEIMKEKLDLSNVELRRADLSGVDRKQFIESNIVSSSMAAELEQEPQEDDFEIE